MVVLVADRAIAAIALRPLRVAYPGHSVLKAIHLHLSGVPDGAPAGLRPISCKARDEMFSRRCDAPFRQT